MGFFSLIICIYTSANSSKEKNGVRMRVEDKNVSSVSGETQNGMNTQFLDSEDEKGKNDSNGSHKGSLCLIRQTAAFCSSHDTRL